MGLRAVLFDLDGTLIDSSGDFTACVNEARQAMGLAPVAVETVRPAISGGSSSIIKAGFGMTEHDSGFDELHQSLLESYQRRLADSTQLFPGMDLVLGSIGEWLMDWGVVTNKPQRYTDPLLHALGLRPRCLVCPDHLANPKPDPEGLLLACRQVGAQPGQVLYVGDHERDIEAGRRAGCITVAAAWGFSDAVRGWGADLVAEVPTDLLDMIERRR